MRVWCRVTDRREKELLRVRTGSETGGLSAGRRSAVAPCVVRDAAGPHPREVRAASCGDGVCGVLGGAPFVCGRHLGLARVLAEALLWWMSAGAVRTGNAGYFIVVQAGCPVLSGKPGASNAPSWIVVADAGLTASTSVRTSCLVPGHSCDTTRCEGMCYHCAGITIYLGKHAGNNRSKSVRAAANLHGCSFTFSTRENEVVRPAPVVMHSHSHVLNGACCCFSEAGSVCQRDRRTWLVWQEFFPERHWSVGLPQSVARRGGDGSQGLSRGCSSMPLLLLLTANR
ncbi:hypothetical protein TcBrA4_0023000 [Trypanosoma cruzi]|nr:hypothetical protein TcBrA4_0023000 [Trypanosoma cruzi]